MALERSVFSARYCFVENLHRRWAPVSFTVSFPDLLLLHSLIPRPPTPSQSHSQTSHSFMVSFPDLPLLYSLIPRPPTPSQSHSQTSCSFSLIPRPPTPSQSHSQTSHSFMVSFPDHPLLHSLIPRPKTNLQCVYHVQYHLCTCQMRSGGKTTYYL